MSDFMGKYQVSHHLGIVLFLFNLDISTCVGGEDLKSGGQVFRTIIAWIFRFLVEHEGLYEFTLSNIRKDRKPKTGMRPQHLQCVRMMKDLCDLLGISISIEGLSENSEILIIRSLLSERKSLTNPVIGLNFNVGNFIKNTDRPSEEAASLVMQAFLMCVWGMFPGIDWKNITFGGGVDVNFSPPSDFMKTLTGYIMGLDVVVSKGHKKTGLLIVSLEDKHIEYPTISDAHLLDQILFTMAFSKRDKIQVEYTCKLTDHTKSQMFILGHLSNVTFTIDDGVILCCKN